MQIGNFATAYFTVVIAIHTCSTLVFRFRQTVWVGATVVAVGWASSLVIGKLAFIKQGAHCLMI